MTQTRVSKKSSRQYLPPRLQNANPCLLRFPLEPESVNTLPQVPTAVTLEMLLPGQVAIIEESEEEEIGEEHVISEEEDAISEEDDISEE
ncbi:hypothetical protein AVEN_211865-1 [Araneus ventricosus]|uniref:Uncharacterized protein n=1 Tax=Araneus ventricosus TaxID=182803 RepID=A0A4Y2TXS0_ARAVE|nr:hypothetical protein AVEN_211865-1 [Araneus ventricosus]